MTKNQTPQSSGMDAMNVARTELRAAIDALAKESSTLDFVRSKGNYTEKAERCYAAAQARVEAAITAAFALAAPAPQAVPAGAEPPKVPADVLHFIQAYGDSRADDDGLSGQRLREAIVALREWAHSLSTAPQAVAPEKGLLDRLSWLAEFRNLLSEHYEAGRTSQTREKQAAKPKHSPLPAAAPLAQPAQDAEPLEDLQAEMECDALSAWNSSPYSGGEHDAVHPMFLDAFIKGCEAARRWYRAAPPSPQAVEGDALGPDDEVKADAARWRVVADLFDNVKTSRADNVLEGLGIHGYDGAEAFAKIIDEFAAARAVQAQTTQEPKP